MNESVKASEILFALLLSLIVTWSAKRAGYFQLPPKKSSYPLSFKELACAFGIYLLITFLFFPLLVALISYLYFGTVSGALTLLSKEALVELQLGIFFLLFLALLLYLRVMKRESSEEILWGGKREDSLKNFGFGALTLIVAYPTVLFISLIVNYLTLFLFGKSGVEQTAVALLKNLMHTPILFTLLSLGVIFVVPFIEEVLFRGFLQTYLRRFLGRGGAIAITSFLFASAHYSKGQGWGNVELIISLFVLSLFLGFIYERQRSIIAPYGLHMCFNASTILAISWSL